MSPCKTLQEIRLHYEPLLPEVLLSNAKVIEENEARLQISPLIEELFPYTAKLPILSIILAEEKSNRALRVGIVFSGGQAPGGHNVITGLFDRLKKYYPNSILFGFYNGPRGILNNEYTELTEDVLAPYRNQGGFDLLGSGRDKIETEGQLITARETVERLNLDGLVIIGGDDSNTNAAILAEHFTSVGCDCSVVGVPKTIDGDLQNQYIDISFGFDTASKVYSETIGNLLRDALSSKKYYYFVKIMGRSASHLALECAFNTHPNLTLISEEIAEKQQTLREVIDEIVDLILSRAANEKNYGLVLIPEGVIEFIPEMNVLIKELNGLLAEGIEKEAIPLKLSSKSKPVFESLSKEIQLQLLMSRDAHGNVLVSKIETERFFIELVKKELKRRDHQGSFDSQPFFCGYEGRSAYPSNFDANYCYALGNLAAILIDERASGYICCLKNLKGPVETWIPIGVPLVTMMTIEERKGKNKTVIKKSLVDTKGKLFNQFKMERVKWRHEDLYCYPGPMQF